MNFKLLHGDSLDQLKKIKDNQIDAVVTDPPYGLSFMGKKWDYDVPSVELWKEVFRVLKPGGHLLSFAGTRTYHRMAVNIEDAGFEIRDMISWLYGSGFPKSFNVAKGIEGIKLHGSSNTTEFRRIKGETARIVNGYTKMENEQGNKPRNYNDRNGESVIKPEFETPEAKQWEGYGTALKPACEPIVVARKPISEKNIALNVLKHGTGGINIDGCRVGTNGEQVDIHHTKGASMFNQGDYKNVDRFNSTQGRFPANIILDEEAGKILDEQSGLCKTGDIKNNLVGFKKGCLYGDSKMVIKNYKSDKPTGASRFFYCAKASKSERNFGLEDFEEKGIEIQQPHNSKNLEERYSMKSRNHHPTVKPVKLMQYLVRLVTPKGAICLDPFMGSGTTGIACQKEGVRFVGIEREEEYLKIAQARIEATTK